MPEASISADVARSTRSNRTNGAVQGLIFAGYICARILEVVPTAIPRTPIVALDVLSAMAFALTDGARHFGLRGILVFAVICTVVGNVVENIGVTTGFPFGHYYFVELMGPKLFHVPVLLGLAYIGMAYVSWMLATQIVGGRHTLVGPFLASFIMTAWDLAQDPVWATVLHGWAWRDGGLWFGVPISNYLGWYATVLYIYLLFAIYLRCRHMTIMFSRRQPAILFYALCAAGNVLQVISSNSPTFVQDPTGRQWRVAEITTASALVSIFVMGSFAAAAWIRRPRQVS